MVEEAMTTTRVAARAALLLIAAGVIVTLWSIHVSVTGSMWPFWSGHHPRLLLLIVGPAVWVVVGIVALALALFLLWLLWGEAFGRKP